MKTATVHRGDDLFIFVVIREQKSGIMGLFLGQNMYCIV